MRFIDGVRRLSDKALDALVGGGTAQAACKSETYYKCVNETWGCRSGLCRYECHVYQNCTVACTKIGDCR
ncbi:hypothetical protein FB566_4213 [Stackebrandtia endophytica]|uniref:Uncharacterized protein n=1 Tax=Stackebrandtia endophytica TaxID=1496996 RepID=A0A543B1B1_9ACTN|nr:hypothetical protein [Stackebrandtia endophytica]TQL78623.1 hypothetical protein FB566_4213 [Stackebrandtia endophytica]